MRKEKDKELNSLHFTYCPINPATDAEIWVQFARGFSKAVLNENDEYFVQTFGKNGEKYLERFSSEVTRHPDINLFVLHNNTPVGMIMCRWEQDDIGYISQLYLVPEYRNKGLGEQLLRHIFRVFQEAGRMRARLSVSLSNAAALRFYQKHGWQDLAHDLIHRNVI